MWPSADRHELSIDLLRYRPRGPAGVMDYLFIELMLWGRAEGYEWFNLGMAPLAGLPSGPLAPLWNRVGTLVYRHGEHFRNFADLRDYKAKFHPVWSPAIWPRPAACACRDFGQRRDAHRRRACARLDVVL